MEIQRILAAVAVMCLTLGALAQTPAKPKQLIKNAKAALKANNGQEQAEKALMEAALREDVTEPQRADMYFLAAELQRSLNAKENEKIYLKQKYDTVRFFSTILQMHQRLLRCDSAEVRAGQKFQYRAKSRDYMLQYRKALLNGGKFMLKRQSYADAFDYFDMYLRVPQEPIFEWYTYMQEDTVMTRVAYWASISAYNANQPERALRYIDRAVEGSEVRNRPLLVEYKVRCYEAMGDTARWQATLEEGVRDYPWHDYFYLHMMDVYSATQQYEAGVQLSDTVRAQVGERYIYWLGKSHMQMNMAHYEDCVESAERALALDSTLVDAYYNKGISYLNMAIEFAKTMSTDLLNPKTKRDRAKLKGLYTFAQEPLEQVRRLLPDEPKKWAEPLYQIYLNLNLGDEFAEMERILLETSDK